MLCISSLLSAGTLHEQAVLLILRMNASRAQALRPRTPPLRPLSGLAARKRVSGWIVAVFSSFTLHKFPVSSGKSPVLHYSGHWVVPTRNVGMNVRREARKVLPSGAHLSGRSHVVLRRSSRQPRLVQRPGKCDFLAKESQSPRIDDRTVAPLHCLQLCASLPARRFTTGSTSTRLPFLKEF